MDVVYNASNNELVRTKSLVKGCIIQVDPTPFKAWYEQHYGVKIGIKKALKKAAEAELAEKKLSIRTATLTWKKIQLTTICRPDKLTVSRVGAPNFGAMNGRTVRLQVLCYQQHRF